MHKALDRGLDILYRGVYSTGMDTMARTEELRKERRRLVRIARRNGDTVPFEMRTLIEDGHSLNTIRRVMRRSSNV